MNNLEEEANNVKHSKEKMTIVVVTDIVLHRARHRVMSALPSSQINDRLANEEEEYEKYKRVRG